MRRHGPVNMRRLWPLVAALLATAAPGAEIRTASAAPLPEDEPTITTPGPDGDYLRAMHEAIHFRWTVRFVRGVLASRPATDPLNRAGDVEVLFVVRWDGSPADITVTHSSGVKAFDQAAVEAVRGDRPYPVPPIDTYGDDGVAHFRWVFSRGPRLCSQGQVRRVEAPLAEALPRLFYEGRIREALLRAARYSRDGDPTAMSTFARAWLQRRFPDPALEARAAAALAQAGDARQVDRLKAALNRPDSVEVAASALGALKVDLCPLVQPRLEGGKPDDVLAATRILRAGRVELPAESPCVTALVRLVKNELLAAPVRADALETLAAVNPSSARRPALNALGEKDSHLRAAGAAAFARPGGGRPTLYRLEPLIKDPAVEVRAAAAAGLIRACGDLAHDYVAPLLKAGQGVVRRLAGSAVEDRQAHGPRAEAAGAGGAGPAQGRAGAVPAAGGGREEGPVRLAGRAPDRLRQRRSGRAAADDEGPRAGLPGLRGAAARGPARRSDGLDRLELRSPPPRDAGRRVRCLAGERAGARGGQVTRGATWRGRDPGTRCCSS
jgi:TonB family protein